MARTSKTARPSYGAHLTKLRVNAGLTQVQLAEATGLSQSNIAFWERADKPPRGEVLPVLAKALGVTVAKLLDEPETRAPKEPAAQSRAKKVFADLMKLPRRQQDKVLEMVEAFVTHTAKAS
jgi:transcriptional regulator with XRE-family HTH domain